MRVLLIHEHGADHGSGAVIAMYRLHRGLQALGVDSTIGCRRRSLDGDDVVEVPRSDLLEEWLGKITWRLGLNDIHCVSTRKLTRFEPFRRADVVNIHGFHTNWFSYLALPRLCRHKPIVATLHDMWNLTGHCAYTYGCERWRTGCGRCPHLDTHPKVSRDATRWEWKLKRRVYRRAPMHVVAPSRFLVERASESMMGHLPLHQVKNPVETDLYRPEDRAECRAALGLPADKLVIGFISMSLSFRVKGADLLLESLRRLPQEIRERSILLALGDHGEAFAEACDLPTHTLGYVRDTADKRRAYCAADVIVVPSRFENQSLVALESMSCARPVVAFETGGLPEIVRTGETGHLATLEDVDDFAAGLARLLGDAELRGRLGRQAREMVVREHAVDVHARKYVEVYEEAIRGYGMSDRG